MRYDQSRQYNLRITGTKVSLKIKEIEKSNQIALRDDQFT